MKLSLVICSRNRASQLEETLKTLVHLEWPPSSELIIVDNGSSDGTRSLIDGFKSQAPVQVVDAFEPQRGLGTARNRGWRLAKGEILAFTDDDCYPKKECLQLVIDCFQEDPRLGFLGGRILLHDPTDYPITIQESDTRHEILPGEFIKAGLIQGANMAIRRTALESVGGFDSRLGTGALFSCEDVDVVARISAKGWHGAFDPRPLVYHHHRRKDPAEINRLMRDYDRGRGAYYAICLLNPALRKICFKNIYSSWRMHPLKSIYWSWRKCSLGQTSRELSSIAEFFARSGFLREFRGNAPQEMDDKLTVVVPYFQ